MRLNVITRPTGYKIYQGPSLFDNQPIVAIVTGTDRTSDNPKTGDMLQVWIIRADEHPQSALDDSNVSSICGDCKHVEFGSCYVMVGFAPTQVWRKFKRDGYPTADASTLELFRGRTVRLGAYGDPAAVPIEIWRSVCSASAGWTGYTHAWTHPDTISHRDYLMASCDTLDEAERAIAAGWKPFYVRGQNDPLPDRFFSCPASKEQNKRLTCQECLVCKGGTLRNRQGCVSIIRHGSRAKMMAFDDGIGGLSA